MGTTVYVTAADPEVVARADESGLCELLTGPDAWVLDDMWWVATSLLTPSDLIDGDAVTGTFSDTPVLYLDRASVARKLRTLSQLDRDELLRRYRRAPWRAAPLGPEPNVEDADWVVEGALQLIDLYRSAVRDGHVVLTAVVGARSDTTHARDVVMMCRCRTAAPRSSPSRRSRR